MVVRTIESFLKTWQKKHPKDIEYLKSRLKSQNKELFPSSTSTLETGYTANPTAFEAALTYLAEKNNFVATQLQKELFAEKKIINEAEIKAAHKKKWETIFLPVQSLSCNLNIESGANYYHIEEVRFYQSTLNIEGETEPKRTTSCFVILIDSSKSSLENQNKSKFDEARCSTDEDPGKKGTSIIRFQKLQKFIEKDLGDYLSLKIQATAAKETQSLVKLPSDIEKMVQFEKTKINLLILSKYYDFSNFTLLHLYELPETPLTNVFDFPNCSLEDLRSFIKDEILDWEVSSRGSVRGGETRQKEHRLSPAN